MVKFALAVVAGKLLCCQAAGAFLRSGAPNALARAHFTIAKTLGEMPLYWSFYA